MSRTFWRRVAIAAWLATAVVTWNTIYGELMHQGVLTCIARQERYGRGEGPPIDIDQAMSATLRRAVGIASAAAAVVLVPGIVVLWKRKRP